MAFPPQKTPTKKEAHPMSYYLFQGSYTPEAWSTLVKKPRNRLHVIKGAIEKLGGRVEGFWLSFGDHDVVGVIRMPNNVSAAALSIATAAGGALKSSKTTPMLTFEEGLKAMRLAGKSGYRPPK
jgi:uncharacterized protein with GYD domain